MTKSAEFEQVNKTRWAKQLCGMKLRTSSQRDMMTELCVSAGRRLLCCSEEEEEEEETLLPAAVGDGCHTSVWLETWALISENELNCLNFLICKRKTVCAVVK